MIISYIMLCAYSLHSAILYAVGQVKILYIQLIGKELVLSILKACGHVLI